MGNGKVIKGSSGSSAPPGRRPVPPRRNLGGSGGGRVMRSDTVDAQSQAQEIILNAQKEAEHIRAQAEEYKQQGYDDGRAQALEEGKASQTESLLRMNRENDARFRHFEHDLVRLSTRIAEKIIGEQLRLEPNTITEIVAKAIQSVRHQREIYLRVNPEDFEIISREKYVLIEQLSRASDIDLRPDPGVPPGGCLIETETGTIDASLDKQIAAIRKILIGDA